MKLHDFDKIFCIGLKDRKDRRERCDEIFNSLNMKVDYFDAIPGKTIYSNNTKINVGNMGCCMSHYLIWDMIKKSNWQKILILEDDVEFHDDIINLFENFYKQVPDDWKMLYLGGNHCGLELQMISQNIHRLRKTYTTHCYAIKKETVDDLFNHINLNNIFHKEIDVHLSYIHTLIPCYGFYPHLAWQRNDFSNIQNMYVDYSYLK